MSLITTHRDALYFPVSFPPIAGDGWIPAQKRVQDHRGYEWSTVDHVVRGSAVLRYGRLNEIMQFYLWARLARAAGLPALPVQVIDLRGQHKAPYAFGNLMQIPRAKVCNWLWDLPTERVEQLGIDGSIVARLKALYIAAGGTIKSRSADFFLSTKGIPFILPADHVFPLDTSNGWSKGVSGLIDIELAACILSDVTQLQIAILFWEQQLGQIADRALSFIQVFSTFGKREETDKYASNLYATLRFCRVCHHDLGRFWSSPAAQSIVAAA